MSSEITDMIDALRNGTMTLDEVANKFRQRSWPRRTGPAPRTYLELAAASQQDPGLLVPNSFDDVVVAYDLGKVTDEEYAVLAQAVAESKRAEDDNPETNGTPEQ